MRRFRLHAVGFIMYLVLALLKVALVNFTLNEYMMMMMMALAGSTRATARSGKHFCGTLMGWCLGSGLEE